jgi:hypothetical protein
MFDEPEILVPREMPNIRRVAGDQIIDGNDAMPFRKESINQMRSEKTRTAGHDGNGLGVFGGHLGFVSIGNYMNLPAGKSGKSSAHAEAIAWQANDEFQNDERMTKAE